ncbi:hypothetical protein QBC47DRAFT_358385 [Echria macrotheca]|uniref:Cenp-O kinetochore centromere component n=1 Tax=Echria macrotheca TaxID=438768 RepID=A0AAJ0BHT8_9PEZI|nr:hypothetical protein QBC47DRAFT_358385 [Echria macrotheca]
MEDPKPTAEAPTEPSWREKTDKIQRELDALKAQVALTIPSMMHLDRTLAKARNKELAHRVSLYDRLRRRNDYRLGGITSFPVRDPDPFAINNGHVLAFRFDLISRTKYLEPYFVLLQHHSRSDRFRLRLLRHTFTAGIPVEALARRYISPDVHSKSQKVDQFLRRLRHEASSYHHRLDEIADLRKLAGLGKAGGENQGVDGDQSTEEQAEDAVRLQDVSLASPDARSISVRWSDGSAGRIRMDDEGTIVEAIILSDEGARDVAAGERIVGGTSLRVLARVQP